ncbi:hypothetical protein JOF41_003342 [Saccharothrix coeruleofusca]|nr:hypothetical protein [Saccharothrix coeruleofusca]
MADMWRRGAQCLRACLCPWLCGLPLNRAVSPP